MKNYLKDLIYPIKKIDKSTKHINDEMEEAAEEFYTTNRKDKEKDDGLSL